MRVAPLRDGLAKLSAGLLLFAIATAPLPFGSAEPAVMSWWCAVLGVAAMCAPVRQASGPQFAFFSAVALMVAAYGVVLHEQLASQPWFPISRPDPIWRDAAEALGTSLDSSVSIARHEPFFAIGSPLVCILALICGFLVGSDRSHAKRVLSILAWSGLAYAAYGILAHVFDPTEILWREKTAYLGNLTGTFINRNTAAVYFGSCSIVSLALLSDRVRRILPRGPIRWRYVPRSVASAAPRAVVWPLASLFVCLVAMFMTGSRAGVMLSLMALVIAFWLCFRRDLPQRTGVAAVLLGGGAVVFVLLEIMGGDLNTRFEMQGLADGGRLSTYRATLRMIADHPWLGTGQGTFVWIYPAYRTDDISIWGIWDRAHNTLLELAADMGIPLAALVALGWILIFAMLIRGVRVRRRDLMVPAAALSVAILAALHSLIDFSLQIPGYAIPALALIGVGLAQSFASTRSPTSDPAASVAPAAQIWLTASDRHSPHQGV